MNSLEQPSVQPHQPSDNELIRALTARRLRQLLERAGEPIVQNGQQVGVEPIDPDLVRLGIAYLSKLDHADHDDGVGGQLANLPSLFAPNA